MKLQLEAVSLAQSLQGKIASLSNYNKIHIPAALKLTYSNVIFNLFNLYKSKGRTICG